MKQKRVQFDFELTFTNGGGLQGQGFRLDIEGEDISDEELAAYIIQDLRLLMVGQVVIHNKLIITEPHKRMPPPKQELSTQHLDLSQSGVSLSALFSLVGSSPLRVTAPDGENYLIRRAVL